MKYNEIFKSTYSTSFDFISFLFINHGISSFSNAKVHFGVDCEDDDDSGVGDGGGGGGGGDKFVAQLSQRDELCSFSHICSAQQSVISWAVPIACFPQFMHIQNCEVIFLNFVQYSSEYNQKI